ncbi:helix-turn-helix domain-containing protein [Desulfobacula sp.]|uniref:helix-turn-helix domain-containing protein n=1 Tax=Desulfobacula sp. TaxID=2593537 RepID=UPI00262006F0|nr:helix-turn-helix domain-containing protein [Desulfobacula sp.]
MNTKTIGKLVRKSRKEQGLTQAEVAGYLNIGIRFLSDLENGKPTVQMEKALNVLKGLGYEVFAIPKANHRLIRYIEDHQSEK